MKLNIAIRLGATLDPQAFGSFMDHRGGTCAWGAAFRAISLEPPPHDHFPTVLPDPDWKIADEKAGGCRVCGWGKFFQIRHMIAHLNDTHRWSREQIAAYLQPLEEAAELKEVQATDQRGAEPVDAMVAQ